MAEWSFAKVHEELRRPEVDALPRVAAAVLRNVTVEPLAPYLKHRAARMGARLELAFAPNDSILQTAADPSAEVWRAEPRVVLVFARLEVLSEALAFQLPSLRAQEIADELARVHAFIEGTLAALRAHCSAAILWHGFELPAHPAYGIYDGQIEQGQTGVVEELNRRLRSALRAREGAYFVDLNLCLARVGSERFYDPRYWHIGRAPYSREALQAIAEEDAKFLRALLGKAKKCLVLDCDNVLWGGVIGEDALEGIQLSHTFPGSSYREFQREVLSLHQRGVILALCSKNNEEDVWRVFRDHPDMVLARDHIADHQINWDDKATNLRRIAANLNIGTDSLVFVDDSDFEVNLVRSLLPEVEVIHLPSNQAVRNRTVLAACGWFDSLSLSEEDRSRGKLYRAEAQRKELLTGGTDLDSYLRMLELELRVARADELAIPRVAQLTQRTNQFNLTTRRYGEGEVAALARGAGSDVLCLELRDRFGSYGLVGVAILRYDGGVGEIDSFLMSCRVIGRRAEDVFLGACLERARQRGCARVRATYLPTQKNELARDFYDRLGLQATERTREAVRYAVELAGFALERPSHFQSIDLPCLEGAA